MKSVCIKTNNSNLLNYLLNELDYIEIEPVYISSNEFKNYKNIIVHYRGNDDKNFIHEISCILSCLIIDELEEKFLKQIILKNYFYFNYNERKHILDMCYDIFTDDFNGGEIVAKHFFDLGIDKIAYIGPDNVECSLRRYEGLKSKWKELTNKNVPFINCFSELKSVLNELVSSAYISGIRGLFCFNDVTAYKVYKAKQTDNKYHDLSIVGFDNLHSQREYLPDISSIGYDYNELADLVSVTLDARLRKQGNIKTMKVKLPVFLYKKD